MLRPGLKSPAFGWGGVNASMTGIFLSTDGPTVRVKWPTHESWKGKQGEVVRADARCGGRPPMVRLSEASQAFVARGGILADKIGYGKTATSIALIDRQLRAPVPPIPEVDEGHFLPAQGTLIIVPSNLFEQWINEISKFVWDGRPLRQQMKGGWSPPGCPLKIFAMSNVSPLSRATASQVSDADVVICSYRLLYSQIYLKRRETLCGNSSSDSLCNLPSQIKGLLQGRLGLPSGRKAGRGEVGEVAHKFPVLEMFYWKRIIFDEFHELESFESTQQNSLQFLRSHFRWGLTGTPPVDTNAGLRFGAAQRELSERQHLPAAARGPIFMSSLFRVDLPGDLQVAGVAGIGGARRTPLAERASDRQAVLWTCCSGRLAKKVGEEQIGRVLGAQFDKLLTDTASSFLDSFVRQNTAELASIRLEEHVVIVRHTPAERALYLGQAHEAPDFHSMRRALKENSAESHEKLECLHPKFLLAEETVAALERLLKLCSHFQVGGNDQVGSAHQECERIYDQKERRLVRARNQMKRCCRVLALLQHLLPKTAKAKAWQTTLQNAKETLLSEGDAAKPFCEELDRELLAARSEDSEQWLLALDGHKPRSEELLVFLGPEGPKRGCLEEWRALLEGPPVEAKVLERLLLAQSTEQAQNLREFYESATSMDFFRRTVAALGGTKPEDRSCSVCLEDNLPVQKMAITPCAHAFCISCLREAVEKFAKCSLCQRNLSLRDVQPLVAEMEAAAAPAEKAVILFVQFDDLKRKVYSALTEFGIPCTMLQGGVGTRAGIIRDWQNNPQSRTFVLLLSLTQSASGTNLTAASHVIFLHPMLAPTAEKAVGYEMQASCDHTCHILTTY
ncbi:Ttf2 [Symbiodinium natans]|uniref:Ttf2 protein n=1 Tax=Symbiodinium natans TaxID=878477 RepID=A0A812RS10_9DINO|nr:Ttf2 [Symbiodinium natans]